MILDKFIRIIPVELKVHSQISRNLYNKRSIRIIAGLTIGIFLVLILQNILLPGIPKTDIWHQGRPVVFFHRTDYQAVPWFNSTGIVNVENFPHSRLKIAPMELNYTTGMVVIRRE